MNKHTRFIATLILSLAMLSIPTLATAQTTVAVDVVDPADLVGKGAGVLVSIEVTCGPPFLPTGNHMFGSVSLFQRTGSGVNQGSGSTSDTIDCNLMPQTFQILVISSFNRVFKKGSAAAQAFATVCDPVFVVCQTAQDAEEIRLQ